VTKAVIFDCFGVLVSTQISVFVDTYIPPAEARTAYQLEDTLNSGRIDYDTFVLKLSELSGKLTPAEVMQILDKHIPDESVFDLIRELKPKYKIGMLSNSGADSLDELIGTERRALFDDIVLSYDVGYIKPQLEIFRLAARRLHVAPAECVMVDDRERYCEAAKTAGLQAIHFTSAAQLRQELESLLTPRQKQ